MPVDYMPSKYPYQFENRSGLVLDWPPPPPYPSKIRVIVYDLYRDDLKKARWAHRRWYYYKKDGTRCVPLEVRREIVRHKRVMIDRWKAEVLRRAEVVWAMKDAARMGEEITQAEAEQIVAYGRELSRAV